MYDLDKAYSKKFFTRRKSLAWRIPIVCDAIVDVLKPKSVIDVGCGNGDLVKGFLKCEIPSFGIEGTANMLFSSLTSLIYICDLRKQHPIWYLMQHMSKFDLAICFEVAEHIEPEYTDIFLDNLCQVSNRILFSAAGPGQGGLHHHNCKEKCYWGYRFKNRGYKPNFDMEQSLKERWRPWKNRKGIKAYYQNLMYFEKEVPIL